MKELFLRTLTGILLIVLMAGSMMLGALWFVLVLMVVYALAISELFSLYKEGKSFPRWVMALSAGLVLPITFLVLQFQLDPLWYLLPAGCWVTGFIWSGFLNSGALALFWLAIPISSFLALGWLEKAGQYQSLIPLSVIILVWVNDTFAYVVGRLVGRHQLTPRLSPGKTWEGFLGGMLFTLLGGSIIYWISDRPSAGAWILFSLLVGILGLGGDLFESGLKRKMNVKNMGTILPGHGGILDRFDSLLFVTPAVLLLLLIIKLLP